MMFPAGCNIESVPADLMIAITHALQIMNWQENAMEEDYMPDRWKWHLDWEIDEHFKQVKQRREDRKNSTQQSGNSSEPVEMEENAYAARFK